MRLVFSTDALRDLDEMLRFTAFHHPGSLEGLTTRLRAIENRIVQWPESADRLSRRPSIRVVPFLRYPFRLFYRVRNGEVVIMRIVHTARNVQP